MYVSGDVNEEYKNEFGESNKNNRLLHNINKIYIQYLGFLYFYDNNYVRPFEQQIFYANHFNMIYL